MHESYLRILRDSELHIEHRRASIAYASQVMRSVIVDAVRKRKAQRRGGDLERLTLNTQIGDCVSAGEEQALREHEALQALGADEPRLAQVVGMRYFGGYTEQEIADALELTDRTLRRDWHKVRRLLGALLGA